MALGTDYIIRYLSDISGAVKGAKELETVNANMAKKVQDQYGQVTKVIGQLAPKIQEIPIRVDGADAIKTITRTGEVVQTANGSFLEMSKTMTTFQNKTVLTSSSVKDVTSQFVKTNLEAAKGNKVFTNLTDNIKQLAGRALLTIPIWIALRGAIMGSFQAIGDGVKNLIAFDLALQKIRNNLAGTPEEVAIAFKKIRASITEASKATGISTEELAGAVKQFATLGFSANESLQGALGASKLSIALFGDASDTAEAFAKALNILIDRSAGAKSSVDQMNEAFALTSQLEQTNNFEIKGVTEALNKFAGTAAGVGLTMNQTLQILAALGTAGRTGSEGATLLSTSFNTLLKNLPMVSKNLGIVVGAGESTFETFSKILNKITELNNTPGGKSAAIEAISDVFGGARGIKIVQSLVAVKTILDENVKMLPNYNALNEKVKRTLESESGQAKILGNNLKEAGKSFIIAIAGTEDFTSSLIKLNKAVVQVGEGLKPLGTLINVVFSNFGLIAGAAFLLRFNAAVTVSALFSRLIASTAAIEGIGVMVSWAFSRGLLVGFKFLGKLAIGSLLTGLAAIGAGGATAAVGAILAALFSPLAIGAALLGKLIPDIIIDNMRRGIDEKNKKIMEASDKMIDALRGNLAVPELQILIEKLTLEQKPGNKNQAVEIGALRKQLQKQMEATAIQAKVPVEVEPVVSFKDQQEISKLLLANAIDRLKEEGALNSQILIATKLKSQQLNIQEDTITKLGRQLDIEKAINEEKRLQSKLSSDTMKLFDIAKTEGVQVAKEVGDVLSGNTDFEMFARRGGKALEVFKTQFDDLFKQQQALQFFKGERVSGEPTLRGGTRIGIQEEALRTPISRNDVQLGMAQKRAEEQFARIATVQTTVPVTVNANIDISKLKETKDQFVKEISRQLPTVGSDVNNALVQALTGKQGNSL